MKMPRNTCQRSRRYSESMRSGERGGAEGAGSRKESTGRNGLECSRERERVVRPSTRSRSRRQQISEFQLFTQPARAIRGDAHHSKTDPMLRYFDVVDGPHVKLQSGV